MQNNSINAVAFFTNIKYKKKGTLDCSSYGGYGKMVIEVNTDIQNYKETVFLGLTAKQLLFSAASLAAGGGIVLLAYPYTGLTAGAYIAVSVAAPIALSGFYSYNGMGFIEMVKLKLHFVFSNKTLLYISTESEVEIIKTQKEVLINKPDRADREKWTESKSRDGIVTGSKERYKKRYIRTIKHMVIFLFMLIMAVLAVWFYLWEQYGYSLNDIWLLFREYTGFI